MTIVDKKGTNFSCDCFRTNNATLFVCLNMTYKFLFFSHLCVCVQKRKNAFSSVCDCFK